MKGHRKFFSKGGNESKIQTAILIYLDSIGIRCWRQSNHAVPMLRGGSIVYRRDPYRLRGIADISGILNDGRRLEVEVKDEGKYQSKEQKEFEALITENNGIYILARSIDDAEKALINKGVIKKDERGCLCLSKLNGQLKSLTK